jgi:hypothetical protein
LAHSRAIALTSGTRFEAGIQIRANNKFRVQVRRNGVYQLRTFGSIRAAEDWQRVVEGRATAEEIVDQKTAKRTTLAKAWGG